VAAVLSGVAALGVFVGLELFLHRTSPEEKALLASAPQAIQAAGCSEVQSVAPYPGDVDRAHIGSPQVPTAPKLATYPTVPPVSGPHEPSPLGAGAYRNPPDVYAAILPKQNLNREVALGRIREVLAKTGLATEEDPRGV